MNFETSRKELFSSWETLALKEGLIKFQPYIEGEKVIAITKHATLQWSKTCQNVNWRLVTWGTVFSTHPDFEIVHWAGRVHSNVDLISRLWCWVPFQSNPLIDIIKNIILGHNEETLKDKYAALGEWFEEKLLKVFSNHVAQELTEYADYSKVLKDSLKINLPDQESINSNYHTSETHTTLVLFILIK